MSRTRIVKGTYTKITHGEHNMYSNESIITTAGNKITETGVKKGVSYGNPSRPSAGEIKAKCLVKFRPHDKYKDNPDFGFDWLREGDSGQQGDNWFGSIMGKYYEADNQTVFKDTNSWNANFRKDMNMYDKKLKSYKSFSLAWKKIGKKPYLYPIPTLTLLKGKTAIFNLKIEIQEKPKKLTFEFANKDAEKYLTLNMKEIGDIRKGKYDKFNYFKITCKESFSKEQILYVKADGEICGAMRIHPNSDKYVKRINVVFVNVSTNISGITRTGSAVVGGKDFFANCCNQALIVPNIVEEKEALDCTNNIFRSLFGKDFKSFSGVGKLQSGVMGQKVTKSAGMKDYLEERLKAQFNNKYKGYYILYFIGEEASWNGFSYFNSKFGVYFKTHNKATVAHETMHAMNLAHTFDGKSLSAKYTYKAMKTNNILDYSHLNKPPIERFCLFSWQWKILNNNIEL